MLASDTSSSRRTSRSDSTCSACKTVDLDQMRETARHASRHAERILHDELRWLRTMIDRTPVDVQRALVARRGFHHVDNATCRPLENSISAFTQGWANGVTYCECNVTLLSDGHIVLNADKCLTRLASSKPKHDDLSEMNFGDVLRTQLKNGLNAPLLTDVIEHAKALRGKLVVNIKPGCASTSTLVDLLCEDSDALDVVRVITSSDRALLKAFARRSRRKLPQERRPTVLLTYVSPDDDDRVLTSANFPRTRILGDEIDGVYAEYSAELLRHREVFTQLCSEMVVGVWQKYGGGTDNIHADNVWVAEQLVACGAAYVNTDLPYTFTERVRETHLM